MWSKIKVFIRGLFPRHLQVPIRFWYSKIFGQLEPEMKFLPFLIRDSGRVIDIGANRGIYAYPLADLCSSVDLFEPNPICASILRSWSKSKPNVSVYNVAVSDHSGYANLKIPVDASGIEHDSSASLDNVPQGHFRELAVKLVDLDSFKFNNVELIKIDVEGHELEVINGAINTIQLNTPAILVEIEQRHSIKKNEETFIRIKNLGYEGFYLYRNRLRLLADFDADKLQNAENLGSVWDDYINNFLFLSNDKLLAGDYLPLLNKYR